MSLPDIESGPKVSIIVPSHNHARYLPARLDSIFAQTLQDFELIVLDDASTDDSRAVLARRAGDPRMRTMLGETNSGSVFRQWNRGLRMATREYVWIAESDDCADPRFLETLVGLLDRHPEVGVACCQSRVIDGDGRELHLSSAWYESMDATRWKADFIGRGTEECRRFLIRQNTIPNASCAVFRRSLAEKVGGAPEHARLVGDWLFWIALLSVADLAYIADPLNHYRKHLQTVGATAELSAVDIEEAYFVALHVAARHRVDPDVVEATRERLAELWFRRALSLGCRLPWARHWAVYRIGRRFDHRLLRRMGSKWLVLRVGTLKRWGAKLRAPAQRPA